MLRSFGAAHGIGRREDKLLPLVWLIPALAVGAVDAYQSSGKVCLAEVCWRLRIIGVMHKCFGETF